MKKQFTFLKTGLMGLLFIGIVAITQAQTFPPVITPPITNPEQLGGGAMPAADNTVPAGSTVLFYNPATGGPTFKIIPSLSDENGIVFTSYIWSKVKSDGTTYAEKEILASEDGGQYVIGAGEDEEALAPGYHVFRVAGVAGASASACPSIEVQDFAVYVLPPLTVSAGFATGSGSTLEYCEVDLPTDANAIILSHTNTEFKTTLEGDETGTYKSVNGDYTSPSDEDFGYKYQWYSIKKGTTPAEDVRTLITGATSKDYTVNLAPGVDGYDDYGTYTFEVEVEYQVKDKENRDYVTYVGRAKDIEGSDIEINITPQPGKPTITVDAVVD